MPKKTTIGKYSTKINSVISSGSKSNNKYMPFNVVPRDAQGVALGAGKEYGYNRGPLAETFIELDIINLFI